MRSLSGSSKGGKGGQSPALHAHPPAAPRHRAWRGWGGTAPPRGDPGRRHCGCHTVTVMTDDQTCLAELGPKRVSALKLFASMVARAAEAEDEVDDNDDWLNDVNSDDSDDDNNQDSAHTNPNKR